MQLSLRILYRTHRLHYASIPLRANDGDDDDGAGGAGVDGIFSICTDHHPNCWHSIDSSNARPVDERMAHYRANYSN